MSGFVGRRNKEINNKTRQSYKHVNELDCLMECEHVLKRPEKSYPGAKME